MPKPSRLAPPIIAPLVSSPPLMRKPLTSRPPIARSGAAESAAPPRRAATRPAAPPRRAATRPASRAQTRRRGIGLGGCSAVAVAWTIATKDACHEHHVGYGGTRLRLVGDSTSPPAQAMRSPPAQAPRTCGRRLDTLSPTPRVA